MIDIKENTDSDWDFKTANTKTYTHCFHNYPAMMIPQIAERLINMYGKKSKTLFDPYCGTGTSLVEANLKGINAIGTDINPLARLIAITKTNKIEIQVLDLFLKEFNDLFFSMNFGINKSNIILPDFKNIDFWFSKTVQEKLAIIKKFIDNIVDIKIKDFFYVAFSEVVRDSSYTRNSEFKLYRMKEKQREKYNPDVFGLMIFKLARNRKGLLDFLEIIKNKEVNTKVLCFNTIDNNSIIEEKSIDLIVTSPPYGDSKTTVAYGQFSRLSNQWLDVKNAHSIDNELMGGKPKEIKEFGIEIVDNIINQVSEQDGKRAKEVYSFYEDYNKSINNISKLLKPKAYVCYVVGNRRVKGVTLPTDIITKEFFKKSGLNYINTFVRNIPNKRMPSRNSPTNETGKTATTMTNEYIVVMQN